MQVARDPQLTPAEQQARLKEFAARAKEELKSALSGEAYEAYVQRAAWVRLMERGSAFSTNLKDATTPSTYNIYPAIVPVTIGGKE